MEEKILNTRKNGMAMLLLTLLGYVVSIALFIFCITLLNADRPHRLFLGIPLLTLSIAYWIAGIFWTSPLWLSTVPAAGLTEVQKGFTQ